MDIAKIANASSLEIIDLEEYVEELKIISARMALRDSHD